MSEATLADVKEAVLDLFAQMDEFQSIHPMCVENLMVVSRLLGIPDDLVPTEQRELRLRSAPPKPE